MTSRTINRWIYVLFRDQPPRHICLVRRQSPIHIGEFFPWPQVLIRILVTVQTPRHTEWLLLCHHRHLGYVAMTTCAAHPGIEVHGVIEIGVVRQLVNTFPFYWPRCSPTLPYRQKFLAIWQDQVMAIHTGSCWRYVGMWRNFNIVVAITAVQPEITRVLFVAERYRLHRHVANVGVPRREEIPDKRHRRHRSYYYPQKDKKREFVGPFREYLRQLKLLLFPVKHTRQYQP